MDRRRINWLMKPWKPVEGRVSMLRILPSKRWKILLLNRVKLRQHPIPAGLSRPWLAITGISWPTAKQISPRLDLIITSNAAERLCWNSTNTSVSWALCQLQYSKCLVLEVSVAAQPKANSLECSHCPRVRSIIWWESRHVSARIWPGRVFSASSETYPRSPGSLFRRQDLRRVRQRRK